MDKKTELDEANVKATRGPNEVEDVVTPEGGTDHNRDADDTSEKEKMDKVKEKTEKMSEAVEAMFEGEEFSDEFKEKVRVVFETAVSQEVAAKVEVLEASFNKKLAEAVSAEMTDVVESVDTYLEIVSEKWLEENKLALENTKKVEIAESFMEGLSYLFKEHNLEVEQENPEQIAALEEANEVLKGKINDLATTLKESRQAIRNFERKEIIAELAEGLSASDKDRMTTLTEAIEFSSSDEFKRKASIIKENFFVETSETEESDLETLNEEGTFAEAPAPAKDAMSMLSEALKRINNPY